MAKDANYIYIIRSLLSFDSATQPHSKDLPQYSLPFHFSLSGTSGDYFFFSRLSSKVIEEYVCVCLFV